MATPGGGARAVWRPCAGLELNRNFGQTAAMQAGLDHVRGDLVITMDGDLQNDPQDIPMLLEELLTRDLICVWLAQEPPDKALTRLLPSYVANRYWTSHRNQSS